MSMRFQSNSNVASYSACSQSVDRAAVCLSSVALRNDLRGHAEANADNGEQEAIGSSWPVLDR